MRNAAYLSHVRLKVKCCNAPWKVENETQNWNDVCKLLYFVCMRCLEIKFENLRFYKKLTEIWSQNILFFLLIVTRLFQGTLFVISPLRFFLNFEWILGIRKMVTQTNRRGVLKFKNQKRIIISIGVFHHIWCEMDVRFIKWFYLRISVVFYCVSYKFKLWFLYFWDGLVSAYNVPICLFFRSAQFEMKKKKRVYLNALPPSGIGGKS